MFRGFFTYADWSYWSSTAMLDLFLNYNPWLGFTNFGEPNVQTQFLPFKFMWYLIAKIGFDYALVTQITFLWPITIFSFMSPYLLSRKLGATPFIALVSAIFYGTTTYFLLRQTIHLNIAFAYSIFPLIFYLFLSSLEIKKIRSINYLLFIIFLQLCISYEIRMTIIFIVIMLLYLLYVYDENRYFKKQILLTTSSWLLLLNLFWLVPMLFGGSEQAIGIANRGLFGDNLFNILRSFTISESAWTGRMPNNDFTPQRIKLYLWLIPLISLGLIQFIKEKRLKKLSTFFLLIALIGIFLSKQSSNPLPMAYQVLYENVPGFNLFREASKFYAVTAFGYLGLINLSLISIYKYNNRFVFMICCLLILLVGALNSIPLINKSIDTTFVPRMIPEEYVNLENNIIKQNEQFRTLWVPTYSRWSYFSTENPKVSLTEIYKHEAVTGDLDKISLNKDFLSHHSIRYIIIPPEDTTDGSGLYSEYLDKDLYIEFLDNNRDIKRLLEYQDIVVYENSNYHTFLTAWSDDGTPDPAFRSSRINSTLFKGNIYGEGRRLNLKLSYNYNSGWVLIPCKFSISNILINNSCKKIEASEAEYGLNSWRIENLNGDFFIIYYPYVYFLIGLAISLLSAIILIIYNLRKQPKKLNNE